jgi:hypothetical protein
MSRCVAGQLQVFLGEWCASGDIDSKESEHTQLRKKYLKLLLAISLLLLVVGVTILTFLISILNTPYFYLLPLDCQDVLIVFAGLLIFRGFFAMIEKGRIADWLSVVDN